MRHWFRPVKYWFGVMETKTTKSITAAKNMLAILGLIATERIEIINLLALTSGQRAVRSSQIQAIFQLL